MNKDALICNCWHIYLFFIPNMSQGYKRRGHTCADICPHYHWYSSFHINHWNIQLITQNRNFKTFIMLSQPFCDSEISEIQGDSPWFRNLPPLDTSDTITDVQVEELWTRTVKRTPIINPTTGLLRTSFPANISPADCPANSRNASVKKVKEHTNI